MGPRPSAPDVGRVLQPEGPPIRRLWPSMDTRGIRGQRAVSDPSRAAAPHLSGRSKRSGRPFPEVKAPTAGVSARRLDPRAAGPWRSADDLVAALGIDTGVGKSEVSRICSELPRREHAGGTSRRAAKLYWPALDRAGFACRACHRLAYKSSQMHGGEPQWMKRLKLAASHSAVG
jgi:hypothetical protein